MRLKLFALLLGINLILLASLVQAQVTDNDNKNGGFLTVADGYLSDGEYLIHNITVIDGLGNEQKSNQDIYIKDGKIVSISPAGQNVPTTSATIVDGSGLTAMPGLIDMHFHLQGGWAGGNAMVDKYPADVSSKGIQQNLAALLYSGVTTALDLGKQHNFIVKEKQKIDEGYYIAPRYHIVGVPFSQTPSGYDAAVRGETVGEPDPDALTTKIETDDLEKIGAILQKYQDDGISIIKLYSGISAHAATFLINEANTRGITTVADLWKLNMSSDWMRTTNLSGWGHATPNPVSAEGLKWMADNDKFVIATMNVGEKMSGFIAAALLSANTIDKGGVTVKPNVNYKQVMQKIRTMRYH